MCIATISLRPVPERRPARQVILDELALGPVREADLWRLTSEIGTRVAMVDLTDLVVEGLVAVYRGDDYHWYWELSP